VIITTNIEYWPIAGDGFAISRETKTEAAVVTVTIEADGKTGFGECVPLRRYGHTPEKIKAQIDAFFSGRTTWPDTAELENIMVAGPARFAIDTAIGALAGRHFEIPKKTVPTAFTLSGAAPDIMAARAGAYAHFAWVKMKLMGDGLDAERLRAVHAAIPDTDLIVDANEGLDVKKLELLLPVCAASRVVLMEQPLPAAADDVLRDMQSPIRFAADESCHTLDNLEKLVGKYAVVNLKLDKTGGLTHGLRMRDAARRMGFGLMVGCMVSTWASLYPAFVLAQDADFIDLDGAMLLARDRDGSPFSYRGGAISLIG
jgi:L-alanine-DL-glutamate epimerase-like enolase superfamily enzyme